MFASGRFAHANIDPEAEFRRGAAVRQKINAVREWLDQLLESIGRTASQRIDK
ncbi:hypothetical protein X746_08335 [Mesorhizobium sp. LNJC380A00]|nr:hypothetical protein X746_08335 [Mesorhizobium sp. LNJC380A00]